MKIGFMVAYLIKLAKTSQPVEGYDKYMGTLLRTTGCAKIYETEIDGEKYILKYFTDDMRRIRETEISKTISSLKLECAPEFYEIKEHIIMKKIIGNELGEYLEMNFKNQPTEAEGIEKEESDATESIAKNLKNEFEIKKIITGIFNGLLELHANGIVHANLHRRNIMLDEMKNVFLIDYCESWLGKNFYFDYLRLKIHLLDALQDKYGINWMNFIDYKKITHPSALKLMIEEFYGSKSVIFWQYLNPNACRQNYYIVNFISKILGLVYLDKTESINQNYIKLVEFKSN